MFIFTNLPVFEERVHRSSENINKKYILLDVLLCSIAEYFYELRRTMTSPKERVKFPSDTTQQSV